MTAETCDTPIRRLVKAVGPLCQRDLSAATGRAEKGGPSLARSVTVRGVTQQHGARFWRAAGNSYALRASDYKAIPDQLL